MVAPAVGISGHRGNATDKETGSGSKMGRKIAAVELGCLHRPLILPPPPSLPRAETGYPRKALRGGI